MTFQLKNFKSIVASMVNYSKATQDRITDFHVGSVARTLLEGPAIEIDEFYQQVFFGLMDAIPVAVYQAFRFERLPAACASGLVRFSLSEARSSKVTIPAGTSVSSSSDDVSYVTEEEASIPAGSAYVDVRVISTGTGSAYNRFSGTIDQLDTTINGIDDVISITPMSGGREEENDEDMKTRFIEYVTAISRSTVKAVQYGAKQATVTQDGVVTEYVAQVGLQESPGHVDIYIYGSGGTPSSRLIANCQKLIDGTYDASTGQYVEGWRPCGVAVVVSAMTVQSVAITLSVEVTDSSFRTAQMKNTIKSVIDAALSRIEVGGSMTIAELRSDILNIHGVQRAIVENDANLSRPVSKVLVGNVTGRWIIGNTTESWS